MKRTSACGRVGATSDRGVSVGVIDGVTGSGVSVDVGVKVSVELGLAVGNGVLEGRITCVAAGAQAVRRITKATMNVFFIQLS